MFSPCLRDFASPPTPNGFKIGVNADHGGIVFEISADDPQRGGDYGAKAVS